MRKRERERERERERITPDNLIFLCLISTDSGWSLILFLKNTTVQKGTQRINDVATSPLSIETESFFFGRAELLSNASTTCVKRYQTFLLCLGWSKDHRTLFITTGDYIQSNEACKTVEKSGCCGQFEVWLDIAGHEETAFNREREEEKEEEEEEGRRRLDMSKEKKRRRKRWRQNNFF